jgi:hypothetical protein
MIRSFRSGLLGLVVAALGVIPAACQSGGIGDPCTPEDEQNAQFPGFNLSEAYIESSSFQCATRICLSNHFQGRVSCPLGQPDTKNCSGPGGAHDELCDATRGEKCVESSTSLPSCDPTLAGACASSGGICDPALKSCVCAAGATPPAGFACVPQGKVSVLKRFVCHVPGACQTPDGGEQANAGKACCLPGTDTPVEASVCGQCAAASKRDAAEAVYCSCRCGVADGDPPEPDFNFCACPGGFTCSQIRSDLDLGDRELTGKYCIKEGTAFGSSGDSSCGLVAGAIGPTCAGLASAP